MMMKATEIRKMSVSDLEAKLADLDHESGGRRGGYASRGRRGGGR